MQYASHPELYSIRKAKRKVISSEMQNILQESLIRTLYNKMEKYRSIADGRVEAKLKKELSELQKSYKREKELVLYPVTRVCTICICKALNIHQVSIQIVAKSHANCTISYLFHKGIHDSL